MLITKQPNNKYIATQTIHNQPHIVQANTRQEAIRLMSEEVTRSLYRTYCPVHNQFYSSHEIDPCDIPF